MSGFSSFKTKVSVFLCRESDDKHMVDDLVFRPLSRCWKLYRNSLALLTFRTMDRIVENGSFRDL